MPTPLPSLGISWVLSTISGYGVYGLQIALEFLKQGGQQLVLSRKPYISALPPLTELTLSPFFQLGAKLDAFTKANPDEVLMFKHPVLHGSSNDYAGFLGQDKIWGKPNVACVAIEQLFFTDYGRKIAKNYDMSIAISRWNEAFLKSLDIGPVHLCHQGIDPSLFHPGPGLDLYPGRFIIFSGGKFEFRKGQDIVVAAYKRFRERHSDALLITCWQNLLEPEAAAFAEAGLCKGVPKTAEAHGLMIKDWLLQQGLPENSFIELPFTHNLLMPTVLRECDVAIFPNRCEGGTNLVAMEAMACGIPTFVAYNTGQKDLVDLIGAGALQHQSPITSASGLTCTDDWGASAVDEIVEKLEQVYCQPRQALQQAQTVAETMKNWNWSRLNAHLLAVVGAASSEMT